MKYGLIFCVLLGAQSAHGMHKNLVTAAVDRVTDIGEVVIQGVQKINQQSQCIKSGKESAVVAGTLGAISLFFAVKELGSKAVAIAAIGALGFACYSGKKS